MLCLIPPFFIFAKKNQLDLILVLNGSKSVEELTYDRNFLELICLQRFDFFAMSPLPIRWYHLYQQNSINNAMAKKAMVALTSDYALAMHHNIGGGSFSRTEKRSEALLQENQISA